MAETKLLTEPTNWAVVHLPERAFPGVVVQGDSLNILISDLKRAAAEPDVQERTFLLNDVIERLEGAQLRYEAVLKREGMTLPYRRSNSS
jgi:hypothetical protein